MSCTYLLHSDCTVLPFSGIWHQTDKEKLVLAHPEGFSKDHSPSLSLSPHSLPSSPALSTHSCISYLWFQGFQHKLIFGFKAFHHLPSPYLSFLTHYWGIDSCFWSSREAFRYHPTIRFSNKHFRAFLHPAFPTATARLLRFFLCQLFSATYIRTDVWLIKNIMPLSSLLSPMYHLHPSVIYWFLLRWKAQQI